MMSHYLQQWRPCCYVVTCISHGYSWNNSFQYLLLCLRNGLLSIVFILLNSSFTQYLISGPKSKDQVVLSNHCLDNALPICFSFHFHKSCQFIIVVQFSFSNLVVQANYWFSNLFVSFGVVKVFISSWQFPIE